MAVKDIIIADNDRDYKELERVSASVFDFKKDDVAGIVRDLEDTLARNLSLGMSAPQIGVRKRIFVVDLQRHGFNSHVFVNPLILRYDQPCEVLEACESFPDAVRKVPRYRKVTVQFLDERGVKTIRTYGGLLAQAIQHEYDHLNGKLLFPSVANYKAHRVKRKKSKSWR